jgi:hypothetical protein
MVNDPHAPSASDLPRDAKAGDEATGEIQGAAPGKALSEVARRALMEANARKQSAQSLELQPETGGPTGEEPTRYGDWERKGMAVDF